MDRLLRHINKNKHNKKKDCGTSTSELLDSGSGSCLMDSKDKTTSTTDCRDWEEWVDDASVEYEERAVDVSMPRTSTPQSALSLWKMVQDMLTSSDHAHIQEQTTETMNILQDALKKLRKSECELDKKKRRLVVSQLELLQTLQHLRINSRLQDVLTIETADIKVKTSVATHTEIEECKKTMKVKEPRYFKKYEALTNVEETLKMLSEIKSKINGLIMLKRLLQYKKECLQKGDCSGKSTKKVASVPKSGTKSAKRSLHGRSKRKNNARIAKELDGILGIPDLIEMDNQEKEIKQFLETEL